ncbi:efflux transporter outer membrane subunit [Flavisolibacter tropicus]|uniref:RND transporter n=1 Tax=Flavisolibacter tropicus TaxID=1492898 RepID=A0A172U201_9BACT|nr:efflux transporter outer membrane subunit [Flavisolibacter tropicus]ANE53242.1 RND transporter [Flavisolibacter tropicus]
MLQKNIRIQYIIFSLLIIWFTACRVGKNYQRPELELPQQFQAVSFADTSSIADIDWKAFFTDVTLQQLIEKGLAHNHDLLIAIKRMEVARLQSKQAELLQLPDVNLQVTAQYNRPSDNSLNGISAKSFLGKSHIENYNAIVALSWEADIWGKIRRQQEAALARYLQSYEAVRAVQTQLVANIAQGYFNLLMLDRQLEITRVNLAVNDSFVTATRLLRNAGIGTSLAVQQAIAQQQTTALLIPKLEQSRALEENALQILTGSLPGKLTLSATMQDYRLPENLSTGLPVAMVSRRPDVRASEMALVAANAEVGVAQANMYPALNITAGGGLESFKSSNWFNIPNSLFGLAAGSIAQPIFNRNALKTQAAVAGQQREQAVIEFRQTVLRATGEVSDALIQLEQLKKQQQIAADQVDTLTHAVFNAQLLFKSDMANYLEVLLAQGSVIRAQLELVTIRRDQMGAAVELYRSLGGGWK